MDAAIRAAVAKVVSTVLSALPGGSVGLPPRIIAQAPFSYQNQSYLLYSVQVGTKVQVELAQKTTTGWQRLSTDGLSSQAFTTFVLPGAQGGDGKTAQQHLTALAAAAKALSAAATKKPAKGTTAVADLAKAQATYQDAQKLLLADIAANACVALGTGCFAAGMKIRTKRGWVSVEEIVVGDEVAARHESEPGGEVRWQPVEATFRRTGRILHLHFPDGELIRTTPEHPFWVEGRGWTAAGALKAGDRIATLIGDSVPVAEVYDTEQWEPVFNVRVAEFHTYFVGEETWGFAAWAHNSDDAMLEQLVIALGHGDNLPSERLAGLEGLQQLANRLAVTERRMTATEYYTNLNDALDDLGVRGNVTKAQAATLYSDCLTGNPAVVVPQRLFSTLKAVRTWTSSDLTLLQAGGQLALLGVPGEASGRGFDGFTTKLQDLLRTLGILSRSGTLPAATAQAAYGAALPHGNTGRAPFKYWDPNAQGNPYLPTDRYYGYYQRIEALVNAGVPGAAQMFVSLANLKQSWGIPFQLARAEYYLAQQTSSGTPLLTGIEVQTNSSLGRGYVDLMLAGGTAIDCKDWVNFSTHTFTWQQDRINDIVSAANKYLASSNVTNMVFEFRNSVPQSVRTALDTLVTIPTGKRLDITIVNT